MDKTWREYAFASQLSFTTHGLLVLATILNRFHLHALVESSFTIRYFCPFSCRGCKALRLVNCCFIQIYEYEIWNM